MKKWKRAVKKEDKLWPVASSWEYTFPENEFAHF